MPSNHKPAKKKHTALVVVISVLLVVLVLAALAGFFGYRLLGSVQNVRAKASEITPAASALVKAVSHGEVADIEQNAQTLIDGVAEIREETDGTLWKVAEYIPVYGADVHAGRELVAAADDAARSILAPAMPTLTAYPKQSLYNNGSINGDAVRSYCNLGSSLALSVSQLSDRVSAIKAPHIDQINDIVNQISGPLSDASYILDQAAPYLGSIPNILGCYSDRRYLVIAQNPSEIRSTGGYYGAMAPMLIQNGKLTVGDITSVGTFEELGAYFYTDLSAEEGGLFDSMGIHIGNLAAIADYSKAATAVNKIWTSGLGISFDGIIAIDPTVLQDLVGLFGDVHLSNGMVLTGTNTAKTILHDTYQIYSLNEEQDAVFAEAAYAVLDKITDADFDNFDVSGLLDTLLTCIDDHRLLVWMANPTEQSLMDDLGCTGRLFDDPANPVLGVYLNDSTWSKFAWWLTSNTVVGNSWVNADGTTTYQVTTTIGNAITWDEVYSANRYQTGYSPEKRDTGDMIDTVYIFAPMGGWISDAWVDDGSEILWNSYGGHAVIATIVHSEPGEWRTIGYNVTVPPEASSVPLQVFTTPTAEKARLESY